MAQLMGEPNATIKNLNDFVAVGSPYLLIAGDVNNDGAIAGFTGGGLAFLATPGTSLALFKTANTEFAGPVSTPLNVRRFLMQRWWLDD